MTRTPNQRFSWLESRHWAALAVSLLMACETQPSASTMHEDVSWVTVFAEAALTEAERLAELPWDSPPGPAARDDAVVEAAVAPGLERLKPGLEAVRGYRPAGPLPEWDLGDPLHYDAWRLTLGSVSIDEKTRKNAEFGVRFGPWFGYSFRVSGHWDDAEWLVDGVVLLVSL